MRAQPNSLGLPLALLVISLSIIAAVWWWLASPVMLPRPPFDPATKMDCVSYAPFKGLQSPWTPDLVISSEQIAQDLFEIAKISRCVRIYSVDNGLDKVPELASRFGLKVVLGIWIGRDHVKNAEMVEATMSLLKDHANVVTSIIVGSEVILRPRPTFGRSSARSRRA